MIGRGPAQWVIKTGSVSETSIIYSFGIGTNIDFDVELIDRFGATVHAFDPTPRSLDWLRSQSLPGEMVVHPIGVSSEDGMIEFYPPERDDFVSFSALNQSSALPPDTLEVKSLRTIMADLGHSEIDLLKMDIEGSEYEVLNSILEGNIKVKQILVEFHHRFESFSSDDTKNAIQLLRSAGYDVFYTSPTGEEYSFVLSR